MTYLEALNFIKENADIVGTTTDRGLKIGKLIVVPSDGDNREKFFSTYFFSDDAESAILPYKNYPVEVWAIDLEYLSRNNVLFYKKMA